MRCWRPSSPSFFRSLPRFNMRKSKGGNEGKRRKRKGKNQSRLTAVDDVQDGGIGEELQLLQAELLQLDAVHFLSKKRMEERKKALETSSDSISRQPPSLARRHTKVTHTHTHTRRDYPGNRKTRSSFSSVLLLSPLFISIIRPYRTRRFLCHHLGERGRKKIFRNKSHDGGGYQSIVFVKLETGARPFPIDTIPMDMMDIVYIRWSIYLYGRC